MRPVARSAKNHALHAPAICRVSLWTLPQHTVSGNRPASPFSLNSKIQAERPTLPNLLRSDADIVSDGDTTTFVGSDPTIRASGHLASETNAATGERPGRNWDRVSQLMCCYPKTSGSRLSEICGILCLNFSEADS